MKKTCAVFFIIYNLFHSVNIRAQHEVYRKVNSPADLPIIAIGTVWSLYCFTKIYSKGNAPDSVILKLDKNNVWTINRWAIYPYSKAHDKMSWYPFLASMPLPLLYYLTDDAMKDDYGNLGLLYWESLAVTGLLGTAGTYFIDKPRPYTYAKETPMEQRIYQGGKNSFYAGHVAMVATSFFLVAKIHDDYHPASGDRWIYYGIASAVTGLTAYGRLRAGMHFPTDILLGITVGALSGILVPQLHRQR